MPRKKKFARDEKDEAILEAYKKAFEEWLENEGEIIMKINDRTKQFQEAQKTFRIWKKDEDKKYTAIEKDTLPSSEWMLSLNRQKIYLDPVTDKQKVQRQTPWDKPMRKEFVKHMHNDCARFIGTARAHGDYDKKKLPISNPELLNVEQHLSFDIITKCHEKEDKNQLCMFIHGVAGTGKSHVITNIKSILKDNFILTATTGLAAALINGCTYHSKLKPSKKVSTTCS